MRIARIPSGAAAEYDGDRFFTIQHKDGKSMRAATPPIIVSGMCGTEKTWFLLRTPYLRARDLYRSVGGLLVEHLRDYRVASIVYTRGSSGRLADVPQSAVCAVLVFIALKMIGEYFDYHLSTGFSLCVVGSLLALGVLVSCVIRPRKKRKDDKDVDGLDIGPPARLRAAVAVIPAGAPERRSARDLTSRVMVRR